MSFQHSKKTCEHLLLQEENQKVLNELLEFNIKFQLVYMDPPYNTGRLRGARKHFRDTEKQDWQESIFAMTQKIYQLLKDTGFLAVSINQMELFNLKPILDNVFGADCFIGLFPIKIRHKDRQLMINATFHDVFEYLLIYRKTKTTRFFTKNKTAREDKFIYTIETAATPQNKQTINGKKVEIYEPNRYQILKTGYSPDALRRYILAGKLATGNWSGEWYENHLRQLGNDLLIRVWGLDNAGLGFRWFQTGNANRRSGVYFQSTLSAGRPILPCNDLDFTEVVPTIYREGGTGCDFKDSKKPEALLKYLIEICTQPGDLILDPFGGSGTTLAIAEKMGRNAVIIENNPVAVNVIKNRIKNLQTGLDIDGIIHQFDVGNNVNQITQIKKNTVIVSDSIQISPKTQTEFSDTKTLSKRSLLFSK